MDNIRKGNMLQNIEKLQGCLFLDHEFTFQS